MAVQMLIRVCLRIVYLAEIEKNFVENIGRKKGWKISWIVQWDP